MYRRGADYREYLVSRGVPGVNVEYRYEGAQGVPVVVDNSIVASGCWMDAFAADYVTVGTSPALPGYAVFFDGLDAGGTYGVRAVIQDADRFETFVCPLDAGRDGPMQVPSSGFAAAVVIIANLSTTDVANPAWKLTVGSVPDRPVNLVPANGGVTGRAPALTASGFSDADGGVHSASRWQVIDGLNTVLWDETTGPATGAVVSQGILTLGETYWWRVSYQDNLDAWSPWSEKTSFTTAAIPGDLDEDGLITSADVVLCLRAAIGLSGFSAVADMDSDGMVTIADVVLLLRLSLGL